MIKRVVLLASIVLILLTGCLDTSPEFESCLAVWKSNAGPIHRGESGWNPDLDSDGDGTACEKRPAELGTSTELPLRSP